MIQEGDCGLPGSMKNDVDDDDDDALLLILSRGWW